jgi:hypothetical protein
MHLSREIRAFTTVNEFVKLCRGTETPLCEVTAVLMATATIAEAPLLRPSSEEWADPITYMKRVQPIVEQ